MTVRSATLVRAALAGAVVCLIAVGVTAPALYRMFDDLTADSIGLLLISSDLSEVLGVTDRILVMRDGRLQGEFQSTATSEEEVLACAVGVAA